MLEERVAGWNDQWYAEGLEKGVQKGVEEGVATGRRLGEAEVLKRLLRLKFRELPIEVDIRIDDADDEELLRWADRVLTAATLERGLRRLT